MGVTSSGPGGVAAALFAFAFIVAFTLVARPAGAASSAAPCLSGLIFVGEVESAKADEELASVVAAHVADGLRFGLPDEDKAHVVSYYELHSDAKRLIPAMQELHHFFSVGIEDQVRSIIGTQHEMTGYVQATLLRTAGETSVGLSLFCLVPGGTKQAVLQSQKFVRSYGPGDAGLLDRAFVAAKKFVDSTESKPVARVAGGDHHVVAKDSVVVLDASGSSDPEDDAIVVDWACKDATLGCDQQGNKLTFVASRIGTFAVTITVQKLLTHGSGKPPSTPVVVEVVEPPHVTVAESAIVPMDRKPITLHGSCTSCDSWQWLQVSGPVVMLPKACHRDRGPVDAPATETVDSRVTWVVDDSATKAVDDLATKAVDDVAKIETSADCSFPADTPGEYTFALVAHNPLADDRKEETLGVAPRPVPADYVPSDVIVGHWTTLDGAASHDVFGGKLRYHWEVSKTPFPDTGCAPIDPRLDDVRLNNPTAPTAEFMSPATGRYYARLTVLSDRRLGGHESTNQECHASALNVRDPVWLPFLVGGADWHTNDGFGTDGFRLKLGGTVRIPWTIPWLAAHVTQVLLRTDPDGSHPGFGGGTSVGPALVPCNMFQAYIAGFARSWGGFAWGPEVGGEIRLQRYLVLSGTARYEVQSGAGQVVLGSFIGGGLDL